MLKTPYKKHYKKLILVLNAFYFFFLCKLIKFTSLLHLIFQLKNILCYLNYVCQHAHGSLKQMQPIYNNPIMSVFFMLHSSAFNYIRFYTFHLYLKQRFLISLFFILQSLYSYFFSIHHNL